MTALWWLRDSYVNRLSGQVWIWKSLRDVEELFHRLELVGDRVLHETLKDFLQIAGYLPRRGVQKPNTGLRLDFKAEEERWQNLRCFTFSNDVPRKRILSVTSTACETWFLLR